MGKYCLYLELKPEYVEQYIERHKKLHEIDEGLLRTLREAGVEEEVIFIYKNTSLIFLETDDLDKFYEYQKRYSEEKGEWRPEEAQKMLKTPVTNAAGEFEFPSLEKVFDLNEQLELIEK